MRLRDEIGIQDNSETNKIDNNKNDKSILTTEYKYISETGHADKPSKLKPDMKLISITFTETFLFDELSIKDMSEIIDKLS